MSISNVLIYAKIVSHYQQLDSMDAGLAASGMIAKFYGRIITRSRTYGRKPSSPGKRSPWVSARRRANQVQTQGDADHGGGIGKECPLPCILHWNQWHFVVCYKIKKGKFTT